MPRSLSPSLLIVVCVTLLTACGGGSSSGDTAAPVDIPPTQAPPPSPDTVATDCGSYRGSIDTEVVAFRGLPYAAPPLGALRWQAPAAPDCPNEVQLASEFAPPCAQLDQHGNVLSAEEDCLYLNVWTPADQFPADARLPVLFFIHGGGNQRGATSIEQLGVALYDGATLAAASNTVVVTVGYRLGALGFLSHPALSAEQPDGRSGNYGLLDQIAALKWVQRNIAAFGGDPARVTVFGESAGSRNVCSLVASPLASDLFIGAIMQSGGCRQQTLAEAEEEGQIIAAAAGCTSLADSTCLRDASAEQLLDAIGPEVATNGFVGENIGPVVDNQVLTGSPEDVIAAGAHNQVPLIIGANTEETGFWIQNRIDNEEYQALVRAQFGQFFGDQVLTQYPASAYPSPTDAYIAVSTDAQFICPARRVAQSASAHSQPVYVYRFGKSFDSGLLQRLGAFHGIELFYLFQKVSELESYTASDNDRMVESVMADLWSTFATGTSPRSTRSPAPFDWTPYSAAQDRVLFIGDTVEERIEPRAEQCAFWQALRG